MECFVENWNCLVPDRDQWHDFVNTEMKFWVWDNIKLALRGEKCKAEH
jgi:hypothetical protein